MLEFAERAAPKCRSSLTCDTFIAKLGLRLISCVSSGIRNAWFSCAILMEFELLKGLNSMIIRRWAPAIGRPRIRSGLDVQCFVIRHLSFVRHSSFVIRHFSTVVLLSRTLVVSLIAAPLFAQSPAPVTSAEPVRSAYPVPGTSNSSPAPAVAPLSSAVNAPPGYILSANDQVAVEVFGEDDLRTNGRLNGEGNLSVPLLGSVHLAGMTLTQAASKLTDLYGRDYLVNPRVNVMLVGYAKRRFTVLGQVNRPGSYEMPDGSPEGIDLLEAVAMAGGYTRIAAPERISVRRHLSSGKDDIIRVDAKRLARGEHANFTVLPGDAITVGESIF
jgi:protein involved in polysaccharide export with SLBB domain